MLLVKHALQVVHMQLMHECLRLHTDHTACLFSCLSHCPHLWTCAGVTGVTAVDDPVSEQWWRDHAPLQGTQQQQAQGAATTVEKLGELAKTHPLTASRQDAQTRLTCSHRLYQSHPAATTL